VLTRFRLIFGALAAPLVLTSVALAQFQKGDPDGSKLGDSSVQRWKAGVIVTASGGPCQNIVATTPIPVDWPEQEVKVAEEDISRSARVTYQMIEGGVKQMTVTISRVMPGEEVKALVTLEIRRSKILPPENTDRYVLPDLKKLTGKVRPYLSSSPYIESRNPKIVARAKEISGSETGAWAKCESFYKWIHSHVKYQNGPIKGALAALRDGTGDCEEMTCLFIAFCRAINIPARTVHVPGHCYPEFYLCDENGTGHWFPCEATNSPAFGGIEETRPVLEKGDNFRDPRDPKKRHHYLPETLTGSGGKPQVRFVRDLLPAT